MLVFGVEIGSTPSTGSGQASSLQVGFVLGLNWVCIGFVLAEPEGGYILINLCGK